MHELGIAHRDLKPENIMLHEVPASGNCSVSSFIHPHLKVEQLRIIDFGLSSTFEPESKKAMLKD